MLIMALILALSTPLSQPPPTTSDVPTLFLTLLISENAADSEAFKEIRTTWKPSYLPMALEVLRFSRDADLSVALVDLIQRKTGKAYGMDLDAWNNWMWNRNYEEHSEYANFKSSLYRLIDPNFGGYFDSNRTSTIRLDEVMWGGVQQDGIPPLRNPKMIPASEADYLENDHVVFGLEVNGEARAYPKRILAWHEMFVDTIGGTPVAGVYCTLCGTVILYFTELDGVNYELGTSGFLYRSNKLMYDKKTQSLWNTMWGEPVIGPLADEPFRLDRGYVVTTTWGEWRSRHPETQVLSLDTGHNRDYSEGAAYRSYFATDELMFKVPKRDRRLKNKAEVLTLILKESPEEPLAISASFLQKNTLYQDQIGEIPFVVLTDKSGANRVYETGGLTFTSWDGAFTATDENNTTWTLTEGALTSAEGDVLSRLPAQRAFWFGWFAAFPETRLVK